MRGRGARGDLIQWNMRRTRNFPVSHSKHKDEAVSTENLRRWLFRPNAIKQLYKVDGKPEGLVSLCGKRINELGKGWQKFEETSPNGPLPEKKNIWASMFTGLCNLVLSCPAFLAQTQRGDCEADGAGVAMFQ